MTKWFNDLKLLFSKGVEGYFSIKYDGIVRKSEQAQEDFRRLARKTASVVQEGRILDIGSGPGYISIEIAKILPNVKIVGLDISNVMIEIATKNIEGEGLSERITLIDRSKRFHSKRVKTCLIRSLNRNTLLHLLQ